ncbi:6-phosphofructokinase [Thermoclostridium stercorarium subsp. leptospartum DSM 9219]|uniref:6-phosphofructokinase n=1 Tax=Thermoclostridium stercorarium subsp. leptospartum DSM 9219 TaxID=1346611 RepID=A0A1B1YML3_THEST|nr:ATP-dependent 6-phosphofructokinase [Thermoclostridium stercorarium]ANX02015.1 6-phosphofructokinase [Thermoclostridium stercorarium subsp. leptospartum DSM 9219]
MVKRIGLMTSGGDCPGLNTAIRAVVKSAINNYGYEVIGFRDGYRGLVENRFVKMKLSDVSGILDKGGTILGTTNRYNPFAVTVDKDGEKTEKDMSDRIVDTLKMHDIDCLVVIGGDATINYANRLIEEKGINVVAIPKTIENDIYGTDMSFGFMTAVNTATYAIDKLHSTAESHHRVMILEVMGRFAGWVALEAGIAGGADVILIPEIPYDINKVARAIFERRNKGKSFSIIVMSAGAKPEGGITEPVNNGNGNGNYTMPYEGTSAFLARELEKLTSLECRITVLGYLQRGGEPSPYDRILATRFGASAVNIINKGEFNRMVCVDHEQINSIPIKEIAGKVRKVPVNSELIQIARYMGVSFGD